MLHWSSRGHWWLLRTVVQLILPRKSENFTFSDNKTMQTANIKNVRIVQVLQYHLIYTFFYVNSEPTLFCFSNVTIALKKNKITQGRWGEGGIPPTNSRKTAISVRN
jgi:hypothetical protein